MATKFYCDICGREIQKNEIYGGIIRGYKVFDVSQAPDNPVKHSPFEICSDCQDWLWDSIEKRKKELESQNNYKKQ